ncbi:tetratricopeptide repeat protein [Marinicella meishanensis]|uniref:tetratricopeptide repeat protein n=1 Tax=Marinicella meishanensis TaxID=2873263 RepID=UPI001CBF49B9|nr:hypothetical protein [Marinicella sp. NBU2979]
MNEWLIYLGLSLFALALFHFWYRRQGRAAEQRWLTQQLATADESQQAALVQALNQLKQQPKQGVITLWVGLLIIPASFLIDYIWFQDIPLEQRVSASQASNQAPDLATAIKQLEAKLAANPDDLEGQLLYARAMSSTRQFEAAVAAYQKANQLDPNNAFILVDLAEAIAFRNNTGSFLGEPEPYLAQALALNPRHQKGMWLQGIVHFEKREYPQAESLWTELLPLVQSPNVQATITQQINQARAAQNLPPIAEATPQPIIASSYFVVIDAADSVKGMTFNEPARLFVYARAVDGPPMPVAAVPIEAPFSWPVSVTIGDQHSLNGNRKLSDFSELVFTAKLSQTGSATPSDDDINSEARTVPAGTPSIQLTLQ